MAGSVIIQAELSVSMRHHKGPITATVCLGTHFVKSGPGKRSELWAFVIAGEFTDRLTISELENTK